LAKNGGLLRKIADSTAGTEVHGEVRDFVVVQENAAGVGPGEAYEYIKCGRLACAIGAEQADDFTLSNLQFNVVNDLAATVKTCLNRRPGASAYLFTGGRGFARLFLDSVLGQSPRTIF